MLANLKQYVHDTTRFLALSLTSRSTQTILWDIAPDDMLILLVTWKPKNAANLEVKGFMTRLHGVLLWKTLLQCNEDAALLNRRTGCCLLKRNSKVTRAHAELREHTGILGRLPLLLLLVL